MSLRTNVRPVDVREPALVRWWKIGERETHKAGYLRESIIRRERRSEGGKGRKRTGWQCYNITWAYVPTGPEALVESEFKIHAHSALVPMHHAGTRADGSYPADEMVLICSSPTLFVLCLGPRVLALRYIE